MEKDRESTFGLSPVSQNYLAELEAGGWFLDGQDAGRFCLAYAIRAKVPDGITPQTETKWAVGNFDKTGEIRSLIAALYPQCTTPIRLMEHLVNEGLRLVIERIRSDAVGPAQLMD